MRRVALVLLVALAVGAPAAVAALRLPDHGSLLPSPQAQRRAVAALARRGGPVYCGGGRSNAVALTFDDGPSPYTTAFVDELARAGAHATFFLVGNRVQYWRDAAHGELELAAVENHTWSHPALTRLAPWLVWLELARTEYDVRRELGVRPQLFRPPYELRSRLVEHVVRSLGLLEVLWNVDGRDDVPHAKSANVVRNVVRGLRPGAIVELHDLHPWTVRALPSILQAIARRGLRAVTVPELLALDPPAPDGGGCF